MIRKYLEPVRSMLIIGLIQKTFGALSELFLPYILAHMIDNVVPRGDIPVMYFWGFMMLLAALGALLGNIWANRRSARVASNAIRAIRHDLFAKTLDLSNRQINRFTEASLESRLTSDTYHVHNMISRLQRIGIRAPILLAGGLFMTYLLDWQLALILTGILPFIAALALWIAKRGRPMYLLQQEAVDVLVRKVRETVSGIKVIKSLVTAEREKEHFKTINQGVVDREKRAAYNMAMTNPLMTILMNIGLSLVLIGGAFLINLGRTDYGSIVAFLTYFTIITNSMVAITRVFTIYNRGMASSDRIQEVLDTPRDQIWLDEIAEETILKEKMNPSGYHIEFNNVGFAYQSMSKPTLKNINFKLRHGETIGILGETGSGKSTLIALLLRLYDVAEGEILIDGIPIEEIPKEKLYSMFGVSLQNDFLYGDTILNNIDFGRDLDLDQIKRASKQAHAWEFISEREGEFEARLSSRAGNLSGGQKQRLLISRALAGNPEVLILDDSSSALDYQTDADVRQTLANDFPHTSKVIVAQRISSIRNADLILVLKDGVAVATGRHEDLMDISLEYQEIAAVQMGLLGKSKEEREEQSELLKHAVPRQSYRDEDGDLYG